MQALSDDDTFHSNSSAVSLSEFPRRANLAAYGDTVRRATSRHNEDNHGLAPCQPIRDLFQPAVHEAVHPIPQRRSSSSPKGFPYRVAHYRSAVNSQPAVVEV